MTTREKELEAKEILKSMGYYVGNLWHIEDVKSRFECTNEEAYDVLDQALENDATMHQIWDAIDFHGSDMGLKEK